MKAISWKGDCLELLDQTRLPLEKRTVTCRTLEEAALAIESMQVRGAPAIGVAAAYAIALVARSYAGEDQQVFGSILKEAKNRLAKTRPTAVNLFWALERMERVWLQNNHLPVPELQRMLEKEAVAIEQEDASINRRMGALGSQLIPPRAGILTHCNAGALATAGYGTALGVIRAAWEEGKDIHVYVDETRPLLQGARLTAWEMMEEKIPATLITDNMAAYLMQQGKIDLVIVGADRIAANGDVANKIGTYGVAVLAHYHRIPFYVAAPLSTFDLSLSSGNEIPIEERHHDEVRRIGEFRVAPEAMPVYNPAFDITPAGLISAIITEGGIVKPPFLEKLSALFGQIKSPNGSRPEERR